MIPCLLLVVLSDPPIPPDAKVGYDELLAWRSARPHKRVNGAKLTISNARVEATDGTRLLKVDWAIDYTGPRPPLTILKPTLGSEGVMQVELHLNWKRESGRADHFGFGLPAFDGPGPPLAPDRFVTSRDGEPITGTLIAVEQVLQDATGLKFANTGPAFVTLDFKPRDRGEREKGKVVDAWTGALRSNPLPVTTAP